MLRGACFVVCIAVPLVAQQTPESAEPNSSTVTATLLPCGREGVGSIGGSTDVDWWSIAVAGTTELLVETSPGAGAQIGDTIVTLLDATGAPLLMNDNGIACGYYSRLRVPGLAAGNYFIAVERGALGAIAGSYALDVRCAVPATIGAPPVVAEGLENNDPRSGGTATAVTLDARCNGSLSSTGPGGDWDFWRFTLTEPGFVRAGVAATASHPNPPVADDLELYLFDGAAPPALLRSSATGSNFGVFDAEIAAWLPAGTYHVAVRGWVGSTTGHYYLDLRRVVGARAITNAGGCNGRQLAVPPTNVGPGAPVGIERPAIGRTYTLQGSGLGANSIGIHLFGITPAALDLASFGAPGCTLSVVWIDLIAFFTDAAGTAPVTLVLAEDPSLLGVPLETQVLVFDASNALGMTLSNSVSAVIGL